MMEIRPQQPLVLNFPNYYHHLKTDSKKASGKQSKLRAPWLRTAISSQPQSSSSSSSSYRPSDTKSRSTEHKSETTCTAGPKTNYSRPLVVQIEHEDFTSSVQESLQLAQKNTALDITDPTIYEKRPIRTSIVETSMSPSSAVLSKLLGAASSRDKATKLSHQQPPDREYEPEPRISFTDRRKLNSKELRLELSRGYEDVDCNMKRSTSLRRTLSRTSSRKRSADLPDRIEEPVLKEAKQESKTPSTPIHTTITQNITSYLSTFGLLTPPSSSRKQREEKAKELQHELKKLSIRHPHLTPPRTPQELQESSKLPSTSSENIRSDLEWTPQSSSNLHSRQLSTSSVTNSSTSLDEDNTSLSDDAISPTNTNPLRVSAPQPESEGDSLPEGLFENPRQFFPRPPQFQASADRTRPNSYELPLTQLAGFAEPNFSQTSQVAYDVRDMVMPVVKIANLFGFPHKALVNNRPEGHKQRSTPTLSTHNQDHKHKNDKPVKQQKTGLKVKTSLGVFPRRTFSRASSDSKLENNNPYLYNTLSSQTTNLLNAQTSAEETQFPMTSEASSSENLQGYMTSLSAPVSAFDDDSSDDDYFGDLKNLSGLGTRNLRRRRASSKRFSRDSISLNSDRPFSRLSFSSKQEPFVFPKEMEPRQLSTENFIPVSHIPIPEEAQLSTSAGTFNKARFGSSRVIRENEVHHLKDTDGFDHLVLEQEEGKTLVVSGTLDCLMMELCTSFETGDDETFADVFLRTSMLFTSPLFLLKGLTSQFRNVNARVQERILLIIERWLRTQPEDLLEKETTREILLMFLAEVSCWGHTQYAVRLTHAYSQMKDRLQNFQNAIEEAKRLKEGIENTFSSFPENLKLFFGDENIMLEVAQYLTAVDLILFRDASHTRTVVLWWMSQTNEEQSSWSWDSEVPYIEDASSSPVAERVNRLLRRSANFKFWIQHEILAMPRFVDRADLISSLIHLALLLRDQGNLQSCLVIVDALATDTIISLDKTWDCVLIERIREFSELRSLLEQSNYITFFSQCKDFAIPYFPFFVKAVTTILNQSIGAGSRYSDASKIHVDALIETSLYRPPLSPLSDKFTKLPPALLDFKKYRTFVKEVSVYRTMTKYPPKFVWSLDRKCFVFRKMEIGRLAFPRDRDTASRATSRFRSGSVASSSIPEDTPDASYLNHLSEIIEGRIDTVLAPIIGYESDAKLSKIQQLNNVMKDLRMLVLGEDMHTESPQ